LMIVCCYMSMYFPRLVLFFFFNVPATTAIYTLSLHDALPICDARRREPNAVVDHLEAAVARAQRDLLGAVGVAVEAGLADQHLRSEEHTSELQSRENLVCRLLLEKKKKQNDVLDHDMGKIHNR